MLNPDGHQSEGESCVVCELRTSLWGSPTILIITTTFIIVPPLLVSPQWVNLSLVRAWRHHWLASLTTHPCTLYSHHSWNAFVGPRVKSIHCPSVWLTFSLYDSVVRGRCSSVVPPCVHAVLPFGGQWASPTSSFWHIHDIHSSLLLLLLNF